MFEIMFAGKVIFGNYSKSPNKNMRQKLPFKCPNEVPEGVPQPKKDFKIRHNGGLDARLYETGDLDDEDVNTYAQYRSALALVPCNARAVSVFTKDQLGTNYTVAVIFVYGNYLDEIKAWLT